MQKIRLDLDALHVDSFDTAAAPEGTGTVRGHAPVVPPEEELASDYYGGCNSYAVSCNGTCATCVNSCWASCGGTCYSCNYTCPESCHSVCYEPLETA